MHAKQIFLHYLQYVKSNIKLMHHATHIKYEFCVFRLSILYLGFPKSNSQNQNLSKNSKCQISLSKTKITKVIKIIWEKLLNRTQPFPKSHGYEPMTPHWCQCLLSFFTKNFWICHWLPFFMALFFMYWPVLCVSTSDNLSWKFSSQCPQVLILW